MRTWGGVASSLRNAQYDFAGNIDTYKTTLLTIILTNTVFLLLIVTMVGHEFNGAFGLDNKVLYFLVAHSFGHCVIQIINIELSINYRYKSYLLVACFNTFASIALSMLLIFTVFSDDRGNGRIVGASLPLLVISAIYIMGGYYKTNRIFDLNMAKTALLFGFPLIWHYLAQDIVAQSDRIMIANMVGMSFVGIYGFIYTIASVFIVIYTSIDNVWSVTSFSDLQTKNYRKLRIKSKAYATLVGVVALMMIVCASEIVAICGHESYRTGLSLFFPLIVGFYFAFLYTIPVTIEYYYKDTKFIAIMTFASALINVVLNWLFLPALGYEVAAYTTAISYLVLFAGHWIVSKRIIIKREGAQVFYFKDYYVIIIFIVMTSVVVMLLDSYPVERYSLSLIIFALYYYTNKDMVTLFFKK